MSGGEGRLLHPAALVARWLKMAPEMLAGGIGLAAVSPGQGPGRLILVALIAALAGAGISCLSWWRFRYWVRPGELAIEKGVLQRQRRVIPFDRVQDIAIERPLIARLSGTARVRVETGGAAKDEGVLDLIALAEAQALRDRVRRGTGPAEEGAPAPAEEPLLFAMGAGRLVLAGLFGFSLVFLVVLATAAQQLDQYGLVEWEDWISEARFEAASHLVSLRAALILAALLLLAGLIAGVVRTVLRDFGFCLTRSEAGLRRRRGLLTLSEVVIPLRRIQAAIVESGPVGRLFGWHRLSFQTLGADRKEGGVQVAAPFARWTEIAAILAEAGFPVPRAPEAFRRVPRRALVRLLAPWLLLAAAAGIAARHVDPRAAYAAIFFVLAALWAALGWRAHRHAEDLEALYVVSGALKRRLSIMPYEKLQTLAVSRGPLQRPLRLATLVVDTAGAPPMRGIRLRDLDAGAADAGAGRLHAAFLDARAALKAAHA